MNQSNRAPSLFDDGQIGTGLSPQTHSKVLPRLHGANRQIPKKGQADFDVFRN